MEIRPGVMTITPEGGVPFLVRVIREGDRYGMSMGLVYGEPMPAVEFYDTRYMHGVFGQFVSRYYADTILAGDSGLDLEASVPDWKIDADSMRYVRAWVRVATEDLPLVADMAALLRS